MILIVSNCERRIGICQNVKNGSANLLLSYVSLFLEPQLHIEDKSSSRMLWPNSSVSREVSDSPRDNTHINLHASNVCLPHLRANICIYRYKRHAGACSTAQMHVPMQPPTSHYCPSRVGNGTSVKEGKTMQWGADP